MSKKELVVNVGLPVNAEVRDEAIEGERPNILLIATDQLRADFLGINGHPICQTPHLDSLARAGINFQSSMSECPVCCPARRILMTGLDPFGINMYQNRDLQPFPEGPKVAELMSDAGYQTHAVGKMHTWPPRNRMGFDDIETNEEGRIAGHTYPDDYQQFILDHNLGGQVHAHGLGNNQYGYRPSPIPEWATTTGWTTDRAMRFLRRRDTERPFMLYVSYDKPHPPFTPPAEYYDLYRDKIFPAPADGDWVGSKMGTPPADKPTPDRREDVFQESLRAYAACITHIDARIGQLIGTLRETGILKNTWIIFTADHGDMTMDHQKRAKGTFLAGSCTVPYIVTPPTSAQGMLKDEVVGAVDKDHPVGLQDLMPTMLDIAGEDIPASTHGQSVLGLMKAIGNETKPQWREILHGVVNSYFAAFDGRFRYQWDGERDEEVLFDQWEDPKDLKDLSGLPEYAEVKTKLRASLVEWLKANDDIHYEDGELAQVPIRQIGEVGKVGFRNSPWNNRGWRG